MPHRTRTRRLVGPTAAMAAAVGTVVALSLAPAAQGAQVASMTARTVELPPPLLPNLIVLPATDVHVRHSAAGRMLRFETGLGNIGVGPMEVRPNHARPCPEGQHNASQVMYRDLDRNGRFRRSVDTTVATRPAGCMVFHPYHDHWHFEAASRYTLFLRDRPTTSQVGTRKMSFCLRDSRRTPVRYGAPTVYGQYYGACSRRSPQGISIGWVDVYQSFLAGQAIKLPPRLRDGLYCLQLRVDPRDTLRETNEGDNTSLRAFTMRGDRVIYRATKLCRGII